MKPDFSEFSYGYAVTEEVVSAHKGTLIAAPRFPSLYQEGQPGGGYDVKIPMRGNPVFLQFKLTDQLERKSAKEYQSGLLRIPYYRMHVRSTKHSDQHNLLLSLEESGETVFYIAPEFHRPEELNGYYLARAVVANSAAFSPQAIGPMPDDDEHYIAFERGASVGYRCSGEPVEVKKLNLHDGLQNLLRARAIEPRKIGQAELRSLAEKMLDTLHASESRLRIFRKSVDMDGVRRIVNERSPVEAVGYISRIFFDSELLILE